MSDTYLKIDAIEPAPSPKRTVVGHAVARPFLNDTRPALSNRLTFSHATTLDELETLEESWNALFERIGKSSHLFQSFNWNWHWARIFAANSAETPPQQRLAVVSAHSGDTPVLIFPLVEHVHMGVRTLSWMGDPLSQYGDILLDTAINREDALFQAWQYINEALRPDLIILRKVRDDATIIPSLRATGARVIESTRAPYLDL